nr:HEAT repeat domain-containing protein [Rhodothermaceae bacterium]
RRIIVRSLGSLKDKRAIEPLLDCLLDNDIHAVAARALQHFTDSSELPVFINALSHQSAHVRSVGAELLGHFESEEIITPLRLATGDEDWTVRNAALQSLQHIRTVQAVESIIDGLEDERAEVRLTAAKVLTSYKHPIAIEPLSSAAHNPSPFVRKSALIALGSIDEPLTIPILIKAFNDLSLEVRQTAADELKNRTEPIVIDVLIKALKSNEEAISLLAASTLQSMDPERVALPISEALGDEDFHHRINGFEILSTMNYPIPVAPLVEALSDDDPAIRSKAANTLKAHPHPDIIPALTGAMNTGEVEEQVTTIEILRVLDHPDTVPTLLKAMMNADPKVYTIAADALDKHSSPIPPSDLKSLLEKNSATHRKLGARLLGRSQSTEALNPLLDLLEDPTLLVQTEAIEALSYYPTERVVKALCTMLLSETFQVRKTARSALEKMSTYHSLSALLLDLKRWDTEALTIPAILMVTLYQEGKGELAHSISDALLFHLHPRNKNVQTRLHLTDSKGRGGLDALHILLKEGEWRHLAFFAKYELAGMGYLILKMVRVLSATYGIQKDKAESLICKDHLARFVKIKKNGITYLGCRICGETHKASTTKEIVGVLDTKMRASMEASSTTYRINWLKTRKIVDFERIELGECSEELITEFCIDLGNDSDPYRSKNNRAISFSIQENIELSNELMAVLKRQFNRVFYL